MKPIKLIVLGLLFLSLIIGCQKDSLESFGEFEPEIIVLQVTPALEHWLPKVAGCSKDIPEFGAITRVKPRAELTLQESDLILRLGERMDDDPYVAVMGVEEIVVVAGKDVPLSALNLEILQAIFAGEIGDWAEIPGVLDEQVREPEPIKPLTYPPGHEVEILFKHAYLHDMAISTSVQTYSTAAFLEELLSIHPTGIAYLLKSQMPKDLRTLQIITDEPIANQQYVLAITSKAPEGRLKALLVCLQNTQ